MIKTELYYINDRQFTRTWSDEGRYVVRDGISYEEACDPSEFHREYTEGELIPVSDEDNSFETAGRIMMGVEP